ncbi:TonB-dependent receptor plug domain-containing protein [Sphingomonas faeni]|uniref:TonB-dependent receptor plug domain-containing protein n=1 Tax=Sphingomonas faeni TaxID=185950 RepID=UPI00335E15E4
MISTALRIRYLVSSAALMPLATALMIGEGRPATAQSVPSNAGLVTPDVEAEAAPKELSQTEQAMEPSATAPEVASQTDIVVTGTLVRGIAPVGTNVLGITSRDVERSGAVNAQQLLAQVPQISNFFNGTPATSGDVTFPVATPVIRNLPGINSTLTLLNGRRFVNLGIIQAAGDPGALPVSAIERVEVVPDGGSATYGSDAVGGTINFIPRTRFDGVQLDGTYGVADNYRQRYISALVGKAWTGGSIYAAYSFTQNDALLGKDRDYVSQFRQDKGGADYRSSNCAAPNVIAGGVSYALPGLTPGTNRCDTSDPSSIFPEQRRHNAFIYMTQQLSPGIRFENQVYYSSLVAHSYRSQIGSTVAIDERNPFFRSIAGETTQSVQLAYDPVWGAQRSARTYTSQWGVSPKFTVSLPSDFQLELRGNYGRGFVRVTEQTFNAQLESAALLGTTTATALNPYNLAASDSALLDAIHDYGNYAASSTEMREARAVVNGSLLTLPGGEVRVALGGELRHERQAVRNTQATLDQGRFGQLFIGNRSVSSAFGEAVIPVFGDGNGFAGMQRLTLSAAVRYDKYSDAGDAWNPKFGATWVPFRSLTIRGNYGTSFSAPQLGDTTAAADTRAQVFNNSFNIAPNAAVSEAQRRTILIAGGNPGLKPQTADTFSVGADFKPTFVPGLTISGTYYWVKFKNLISITPVFDGAIYTPAFAQYITINPTLDQARQLLSGFRLDGIASVDALYANGQSPYVIADARRYNLGIQRTQGIDYNVAYDKPTSFGSLNVSVAGSYTLVRDSQPFAGGETTNAFDVGAPRSTLVATAGAKAGGLSGQVQYFRTSGYDLGNNVRQDHVGAFTPVNLFVSYDLGDDGPLKNTQVSVTAQNLFDRDPPFFNGGNGYTNGSTYGRMILLGLRKGF